MTRFTIMFSVAMALASAAQAAPVPQPPLIESAFSPDAGAEALVLKVIDTSVTTLRLAAYSFSSPAVTQALLKARQRGVDVKVLADYRRNQKKINLAALRQLVQAGIPVRTVSVYALHHDKYIVADDHTVQNGSFNYTQDAALSNSENVLVVWNDTQLARAYLRHWEDRWGKGVDYQ
ncbi:PLD-like domain-containing protein [Duganella sacchari]|uniref:phospholipase D n=1 Tax=Duganella sacchari TaxID=551987 RepID=A0A1M7PMW6_9BURK|nr:phospholipase D family protein [Duganella sacchari]SHN18434.1 PLD-like domain-containing protein [Duganella sacchari]